MQPSTATTQPTGGEGTPNPPPPSIVFLPTYQQPSGYLNLGYQPQPGQHPYSIPGAPANSHPSQGHTQSTYPATGMESTMFHKEGKTLGAIQIIIGLLHISLGGILGAISTVTYVSGFASLTFISSYPFVGGLFYIATGIVSVTAIYQPSTCLLNGSIGMSIGSIILVIIGVILLIIDEVINGAYFQDAWAVLSMKWFPLWKVFLCCLVGYHALFPCLAVSSISGWGISALLIIFSVLEFAISCVIIHFARLALPVCPGNTNQPVRFTPTTSTAILLTQSPPSAPPSSDNPPDSTIHS